jgi:membrane fusion protein
MFRREAIEYARTGRGGTVLLARAPSYVWLTWLFVVIGASFVAFFVAFGYTRKAHVPGVLLPAQGLIRVLPAQSGVIAESRVHEGQAVKAGDVLFVLDSERANLTHAGVERAISALLQTRRDSLAKEQEQLRLQSAQRTEAARRRAEDLELENRRIEAQSVLQQRRVALAEESLKLFAELRASNFVSAIQVKDKQVELLDQQQRLADLRRARAANEREIAAARAAVRDLQVQAQRDLQAWQRNIVAIEQDLTENDARRETLVRAPEDGTVTAITAERGQAVSANQALASIIPAGSELEAQLYAPSRSAGFVKPGMDVLIRYQAYSYQKFGQARGRVREVSSTAMKPEELPLAGAALPAGGASEPLYRIRVALERQSILAYGEEQPLKAGAALDASVLLERRRLHEWVLEPLYTISGRL